MPKNKANASIFVLITPSPSIRAASGKPYYPGLNGLRAIAALIVLFTHVERLRLVSGMSTILGMPFNSFLGGAAVTFFFVLSGFLITLLLLQEKAAEGAVGVKRFLTNRVLRIWPLYYLVLIGGYGLSVFVLRDTPANPVNNGFLLNLLLLPNLSFVLGLLPEIIIPLWSIGTEEQFYLVWPFLVNRLSPAGLLRLFLGLILFWGLARMPFQLYVDADWINALLFRTRIDCMATGGLAALLLFYKERSAGWWTTLYDRLLHPLTGWVLVILLALLLMISWRRDSSLYQLYAVLFAVWCLRVTGLPVRWLEFAPLRYLGKISYGIYLFHYVVLYFLFREWIVLHPMGDIATFVLGAGLTAGLAAISYNTFERYFLKKKIRTTRLAPSPGSTLS